MGVRKICVATASPWPHLLLWRFTDFKMCPCLKRCGLNFNAICMAMCWFCRETSAQRYCDSPFTETDLCLKINQIAQMNVRDALQRLLQLRNELSLPGGKTESYAETGNQSRQTTLWCNRSFSERGNGMSVTAAQKAPDLMLTMIKQKLTKNKYI